MARECDGLVITFCTLKNGSWMDVLQAPPKSLVVPNATTLIIKVTVPMLKLSYNVHVWLQS